MPNFWALPPEINSTRIYLGPGSGPILAAAQGWNALASELEKTKVGLQSALDTLLESYRGQSSGFDTADLAVCAVADHDRRARP